MGLKFLKREIKEMQSAISTFYLLNRPLYSMCQPVDATFPEKFRAALATHRLPIVTTGIENMRALVLGRAEESRKTAEHYRSHFQDEEMYERFTGYAAEEEKAAAGATRLLAKIAELGLPPEVTEFDPLAHPLH